ncbi:MAG: hypothetical protein AAGB10_20350 [Pseudomonadota bacterium]
MGVRTKTTVQLRSEAHCTRHSLANEVEVPFESLDLTVRSVGATTIEDLQRIAADVARYCPLSKLFANAGTSLNMTWEKV